jgi:hypothetical protein
MMNDEGRMLDDDDDDDDDDDEDEGSIWDLTTPNAPTWITQSNRTFVVDIFDWLQRHTHDAWAGIQATTQRPVNRNPPHDASLRLHAGQLVTMLAQPFWCWHNASMLSGTYVVAVPTHNHSTSQRFQTAHTAPPQKKTTNEEPRACLLGVVPVHACLAADVL